LGIRLTLFRRYGLDVRRRVRVNVDNHNRSGYPNTGLEDRRDTRQVLLVFERIPIEQE
jgi:hypothetical protein